MDNLHLALTPGEPAGIGPDLCALLRWTDAGNALHTLARQLACRLHLVVMADPTVLTQRAAALGLHCQPTNPAAAVQWHSAACRCPEPVSPGSLNPQNARYVLDTLSQACDACLQGVCDAMVTALGDGGYSVRLSLDVSSAGERETIRPKSGGVAHGARVFTHPQAHHAPEVYDGIGAAQAGALLRVFFAGKR